MRRLILPRTDIEVSRLGFGTASLHHILSSKDRQYLLDSCFEKGITHFDTSPYYGFGLAEISLGKFIARHKKKITVATKVGLYPPLQTSPSAYSVVFRKIFGKLAPALSKPVVDWSIKKAMDSLELSLKRLGVDCVDLLLLHEPDCSLIDSDEVLGFLKREKKNGRIRSWGLAGRPEPIGKWLRSNHPLASVLQVPDSLERREADSLKQFKRAPQITYGYLSSALEAGTFFPAQQILQQALKRNPKGIVLFSTSRIEHLFRLRGLL